ncbi:hypothetical protein [Pseudarthrobacter chlorophenolicus]|uniref:hypothetical protein n=1 Tax=Pseudarthrobacter chlorophenolicus TaxID=85085 RepID=UPI0005F2C476|nr:hypothetical protein [Pseudarthrobacter chlorophenolicus]
MGNSGKFAVICGIVAAGLLVLTGMTLAEPVFLAFLGVLALAYVAAVGELLVRRRRLALLATGAGTSITIACSLAFLSTWELAFDGESSFIGTPLPTNDPDNYFMVAAAAAAGTLAVLFLGAAWPSRRRAGNGRKRAPVPRRPASSGRPPGRGPAQKPAQRPSAQRPGSQRTGVQGSAAQRAPGTRPPARLPSAPARRPSPRSGNGSTTGR